MIMMMMMSMMLIMMTMMTMMIISQAKYAVSYTTINAFVPDRTPRCEVVLPWLTFFCLHHLNCRFLDDG